MARRAVCVLYWLSLVACSGRITGGSAQSIEAMVSSAEHILEVARFDVRIDSDQRFTVAATAAGTAAVETLGVYGEMPLLAIARILQHPAAAALAAQPDARFVDFGSGAGRLLLGVAAMGEWESVAGVEAIDGLHALALASIAIAEAEGALLSGVATSLHASGLPHEGEAGHLMAKADIVFMYSTAFPSEDGLRLPEISASLAALMPDGSLVVTTDKLLVRPAHALASPAPRHRIDRPPPWPHIAGWRPIRVRRSDPCRGCRRRAHPCIPLACGWASDGRLRGDTTLHIRALDERRRMLSEPGGL
jgi:hypothetical protein